MTTATTDGNQAPGSTQDTQADITQTSTDQSTTPPAGTVTPPAGTEPPAAGTPEADQAALDAAAAAAAAAAAPDAGAADAGTTNPWDGADLDEDLKAFVGEKTPAEIARELKNAQALIGKKAIGIPGKDSTPEEHRAFHKARGVPETEEGYDLAPAITALQEKAPEGWEPSEPLTNAFRKAAKLSNMSNGEAQQFAQHFLAAQFEANTPLVQAHLTATKEAKALMTEHWGANPEPHNAAFDRGMRALGLESEGIDVFLNAYGGNGKARFNLVDKIAEIGRLQSEGGPIPGGGINNAPTGMTPQQARQQIDTLLADPVNQEAYQDPMHARNKQITAEIVRLGKIERGVKA